jgi:DNA polymerase-3 subunit delta'
MARGLEHPDVHWYFPLERPKRTTPERLADALEEARLQAIAELRADSLRSAHSDELKGLYLGTVRNLRAIAHKRPNMAEGPIFIVGDADLLVPQEASPEAANALLKLLEEPPGGARFVLTSSEPGLLLPTIRSRTVSLHVGPLPAATVESFLREHAGTEAAEAARAASLGQGSIGRALGFLSRDGDGDGDGGAPLSKMRTKALAIVEAATARDPSVGHSVALGYPPALARTLIELFAFVEELLRDLGAIAAGAEGGVFHRDLADRLQQLSERAGVTAVDVPVAFSKVERARELARGNVNPQLVVAGLIRDLRGALIARGAPAHR